nr:NADH dehydrogenase subunit 5 [Chroodactylon ornatum]
MLIQLLLSLIIAPLLSACMLSVLGHVLGRTGSALIAALCHIYGSLIALCLLYEILISELLSISLLSVWLSAKEYALYYALIADSLSCSLLSIIQLVLSAILVYSMTYMAQEAFSVRYYALMLLFAFSMQLLVSAEGPALLFLGWEAVGLCSYGLIAFYASRNAASNAALKAVLANRLGDYALFIALLIMLSASCCSSWALFIALAPSMLILKLSAFGYSLSVLNVLCSLLILASLGKSAQLGLHIWLSEAMEGPTPVSALLHAATMIVAGAVLALRLSPLCSYSSLYSSALLWLGSLTATYAALCACCQYDIKKVIALSTCSHVALVLCAAGALEPAIALLHLSAHAFAKASLFMLSGALIHICANEQDIRMLSLYAAYRSPLLCLLSVICALSLAGLPMLSGAVSKDALLCSTWLSMCSYEAPGANNNALVILLTLSVLFSAGYSAVLSSGLVLGSSLLSRNALNLMLSSASWAYVLPAASIALGAVVLSYLLSDALLYGSLSLSGANARSSLLCSEDALGSLKLSIALIVLSVLVLLSLLWCLRKSAIALYQYTGLLWLYRGLGARAHWDALYKCALVLPALSLASSSVLSVLETGLLEALLGASGALKLSVAISALVRALYRGLLSVHLSVLLALASLAALMLLF